MYSMMIIVNNTILHILKFLREYIYIYILFCFVLFGCVACGISVP